MNGKPATESSDAPSVAGRAVSAATICARVDRHGLIAAECWELTGGRPDADGVAMCHTVDLVTRGAYVQTGLRVLAHATSYAELVDAVSALHFDADRFRIDLHDPSDRLDMSGQAAATTMANVIEFGPDLNDPLHRFVIAAHSSGVLFGEVMTTTDAGYRVHDTKPWTTSSSLDARFSRALVNLVPSARSIIDPCCGAGSIVLEAASLGLAAIGVDWKRPVVGMTRENLAHFGYDAVVELADSRTIEHRADAVVTDLPYGHAIETDEGVVRSILERGVEMASEGVYVAPTDISEWLERAGYRDVATCTVVKRAGFTRFIHRVAR